MLKLFSINPHLKNIQPRLLNTRYVNRYNHLRLFGFATDLYNFLKIDTDIFKKNFTDIWPVANIQLATDIPKFVCRYFNKVF